MWPANSQTEALRDQVVSILTYQFGAAGAAALTANWGRLRSKFSRETGNLKFLTLDGQPYLNYIPTSGYFSLSEPAGVLLHRAVPPPQHRVTVQSSVAEFLRAGKSVFCKHVVAMDEGLSSGAECLVVDEDDRLLALGVALDNARFVLKAASGMAVKVRRGIPEH
jgi:predicted RNA-binding protein (TIGR00451 family)